MALGTVDLADVGTCDCVCDQRAVVLRTENERILAEAKDISDALRYCLTGAEIIGCSSPGLMDDALERLERLGVRSDG